MFAMQMFDILSFIVPIMFIVVFGIIIFPSYRDKHMADMSGAHGFHTTSSTTYYVTFQVESGDRMEFHVSGLEYGMLAEGDTGRLTFQGTRYLSFER